MNPVHAWFSRTPLLCAERRRSANASPRSSPSIRFYTSQVVKVTSADDNLAVLYSDWTLTANAIPLSGKAIQIVRRQSDGTWRFVVDDPFGRN
jgi:hypothetical protein